MFPVSGAEQLRTSGPGADCAGDLRQRRVVGHGQTGLVGRNRFHRPRSGLDLEGLHDRGNARAPALGLEAGELLGVDWLRRIHMGIHEVGQPGDVVLGFGAGFEVHVRSLCPATAAPGRLWRVRQRARNGHIRQDGNRTRLCVEEESWPTTHVWIGPTRVMFGVEEDPILRSVITLVLLLDQEPDEEVLRSRIDRMTRSIPKLRQRAVGNPLSLAPRGGKSTRTSTSTTTCGGSRPRIPMARCAPSSPWPSRWPR